MGDGSGARELGVIASNGTDEGEEKAPLSSSHGGCGYRRDGRWENRNSELLAMGKYKTLAKTSYRLPEDARPDGPRCHEFFSNSLLTLFQGNFVFFSIRSLTGGQ